MDEDFYEQAFQQALRDLSTAMDERERLDAKREVLDVKIDKLREGVLSLGSLCGKDPERLPGMYSELFPDRIDPDMGVTDAVRNVLKASGDAYLSPVRVKDRLAEMGYDLSNYKNLLSSLHTILKRLHGKGEAVRGSKEGKTVYKWKGSETSSGTLVTKGVARNKRRRTFAQPLNTKPAATQTPVKPAPTLQEMINAALPTKAQLDETTEKAADEVIKKMGEKGKKG